MTRFGRVPPPEDSSRRDKRRYDRLIQDQTDKRLVKLEDKSDAEIEFSSAGIDQEIRISNSLDFVPNRFEIVRSDGAFVVGKSRGTLSDEDFIYLTTDADFGTKFVARFWRT